MVENSRDSESGKDFVSSAYQKAVQQTGISVPRRTLHGREMGPGFVYDPEQPLLELFGDMTDEASQELYATQQFKEQLRHARFPGDEPAAAAMVAVAVNNMPKEIAQDNEMASAASRLLVGTAASLYNVASLSGEREIAAWRFRQGLRNSSRPGFHPDLWVAYNSAAEKLLGDLGVEERIGSTRENAAQTSKLLEILEQMRARRRIPEAMKKLTELLYESELQSRKVLRNAVDKFAMQLGYDPTFLLHLGNAAYAFALGRYEGGIIAANPDVLKAVLDVSRTSRERVNALNALYAKDGERLLYRGKAQGLPRLVVERPELERAEYQRTTEVPDTMIIVDTVGMDIDQNHVHDESGEYHKAVLTAEGVAQLILSKGGRVMPVTKTPNGYAVDAFAREIDHVEGAFMRPSQPTYTHEDMIRTLQSRRPVHVVYIGNLRGNVPPDLVPAGSIVYQINPRDATRETAKGLARNSFVHPFYSDGAPHIVSLGELRDRGVPERGYVSLR